MKNTVFFKQAESLLRVQLLIHEEEMFTLKGGTAINFFERDLLRLSVTLTWSRANPGGIFSTLRGLRTCLW